MGFIRSISRSAGVVVALVALGVGGGNGAPPASRSGPWVSAEARGVLPEGFGGWSGDPVQFTLEAAGGPGETSGTFSARHVDDAGGEVLGDFTGDLTCLQVGGDVAVATGVITNGHAVLPSTGRTDVTGQRVSFTVYDGGRGRMAWMWEFLGAPVHDCVGVAPTFRPDSARIRVHE